MFGIPHEDQSALLADRPQIEDLLKKGTFTDAGTTLCAKLVADNMSSEKASPCPQ